MTTPAPRVLWRAYRCWRCQRLRHVGRFEADGPHPETIPCALPDDGDKPCAGTAHLIEEIPF